MGPKASSVVEPAVVDSRMRYARLTKRRKSADSLLEYQVLAEKSCW